ncbi:uncharacterized protein BO80DRAFT_448579 [Aspergillus ibericus CBS 121593]|uniref:Bromo domain-containing protein n=1 Tax=Aspergillus ibericus CBS 121593 TaxID=1448316 RepID=A0A395GR82_9EURO|nr:hypothetical protein BO80DRAFT_448579 [Aspergillus ibericus CBS 121593]RAK97237.1 hypothetical protein BO80DRAFT_448579 [Aspergillus ibericus CBS 121593]
MPPLSAYTPFESLLFFQSLAGLDTPPANFASISDVLRNNPFIRQNAAYDAGRLTPEALEDLYTTLMRDGLDSVTAGPNGHHTETPVANNPKKRKISSPRPDGLADKSVSHTNMLPGLVSHLYARYKELVTREIRNEEKRYKEIREEIEQLQREEFEAPPEPATRPTPAQPIAPAKPEPAPQPMDVDVKEEKPIQQARGEPMDLATPPAGTDIKQPQLEPQRKDLENKQPAKPVPRPPPTPQQLPAQPVQPVGQPPKEQEKKIQPLPQPQLPQQPPQPSPRPQPSPQSAAAAAAARPPPQPAAPNGKAFPTAPQPALVPKNVPVNQAPVNAPVTPSSRSSNATAPSAGVVRPPAVAPSPAPPNVSVPVPSTPQQTPISKPSVKETPLVPTASPAPQRPPPQASFQQWSLNPPPQTPQPPPAFPKPKAEPMSTAGAGRPAQSPLPPPVPTFESKKVPQGPRPTPAPSTPGPVPAAAQTPARNVPPPVFQTPIGPAQASIFSRPTSARPPRPSIDTGAMTPGSMTPWKKTPGLTITISPRSPERPRPEEISPISEKAPSLMGSREATPEEPEPRRRKRRSDAKGNGANDQTLSVDPENKAGTKRKGERSALSTGKDRDRSTASSRSRGRSVLSRDEESMADMGSGRIKHEVPSTPAGVSEAAEPERPSVSRPGRGRPKRKRAPSESVEAEPSQPEFTPLSRLDPNVSTTYVVCARNFPRTGAPIMNDVTTHKHASIFTKPLTERDAPGYRDLIYRPQDLKSIKSLIHQGSRALAAATEAASTPAGDGESPAPGAGTPSKNAVLMLQKTEDVIPPKGVVNSAQLEKELIRMFANAVMFNPIPQRGFGPAFPMISDSGSRESTQVPEPDEGGIIKDTLEMFEDVEKAVTRWRAAERTADELASKSILSLRRGSASDLNTDSADEVKGS